ncbi:putative MFS family arabinose efflux permease [Panacagrimonas perspica]|uniref:Putative MFS family arabinose efflux permease n=1 Tax=Panacagrimonas perspica TaxID=381431 RepID=A0A4V6RR24_9GAMM|nr:MFS transporter [Panacagrimonas perspica]TDU31857.1 putative MFS family arabinose efflux permease [Panacagrimonas perspica]THD02941.1 MFS transporter [Panacagrimonas perspica]
MTTSASTEPSAFAPLRERAFLVLWVATVMGNTGTWMRDTASGWLMTSLSPSPTLVAMVQAATTLPIFLLALPAGALSDIVDRRRLMLGIQFGLALVSVALCLLSWRNGMTPSILLGLTFCGGIGAALVAPAWQSIVPQLVPRPLMRPAIALNSLGVNIARAIGPAVGGLLIATLGIAAAYAVDVFSYALIIAALWWWKPAVRPAQDPEHLVQAMRSGLRFALFDADLRRVLLRAFLFFIAGSSYWALLPLIVRTQLNGGATVYGLAMASIGLGAILGALLLPRLRRRLSANATVLLGALVTGAASATLALAHAPAEGIVVLLFAGAAWIAVLTTLNATAQAVLPDWVRGRGLALYLTVFFGGMTLGSLGWGALASAIGVPSTLGTAAVAVVLIGLLAHRWTLPAGDADLTPSMHWPEPAVSEEAHTRGGPVMVRIVYRVPPAEHVAFHEAIRPLARIRRRDGAYAWGVVFNLEHPDIVTEWFLVTSWEEHLRQHRRVSAADRIVQDQVIALHRGEAPPRVEHELALGQQAAAGHAHPSHDEP